MDRRLCDCERIDPVGMDHVRRWEVQLATNHRTKRLFVDEDGYCVVHTIVGPEGGWIDRRYRPQPSFDVASAVSLYNELS